MEEVKEEYVIREIIKSREVRKDILRYISYENNNDFLDKVTPKSLYKYLPLNKEILKCLKDNKLYVLETSKLDYILGLKTSIEIYHKTLKEMLFKLKNTKETYKIISLNEMDDSNSMWKVEGENHTGICIEYDFSKDNKYKEQIFKVKYLDKPININNISNSVLKDIIDLIARCDEFSCQKEWRILDYVNNDDEVSYNKTYTMPDIKSITLGKNFIVSIAEEFSRGESEKISLLDELIEFTYSKNIPLFYANRKMGTYELHKIRLNIGTINRILKSKKDSVYNLCRYINNLRIINEEDTLKYIFIDNPDDKEAGWIFATNNCKEVSRVCNYIKLLFESYNCKFSTYIADSKYVKLEKFIKNNNSKYNYCINDELLLIEEIHQYLEKFNIKY